MNVLGLFGFGMNPGACLIVDGDLVAFVEEERFNRYKNAPDLFPGYATRYCLAEGGLSLNDIDHIGFAWDATKYPYGMLRSLARQFFKHRRRARSAGGQRGSNVVTGMLNALKYTPGRLEEEIRLGLRARGIAEEVPPIRFVSHHLCHTYSTYFASPFEEAVIVTIDGSGEDFCTQVAIGRGDEVEVVESIPIPHSLGWFYAAFTAYYGFTPYRHEGKLMALAGLGHPRRESNPWPERLDKMLEVNDGGYSVDPVFTRVGHHSHSDRFTDALPEMLTGHDPGVGPLTGVWSNGNAPYLADPYTDLAWGVQNQLERAARSVAERFGREHGIKNLCVAGGVGLNCKMNGALLHESSFDEVFVQPASHDAGTAMGAAMVVASCGGDAIRNPMDHAYLGPGFTNGQIREVLDACGLHADEEDDIAARVASELAGGRILGWFQGRLEAGPRALGGRSILAHPGSPDVIERLSRIKAREPWRPFCPSILDEAKDDYFENARTAPFMTTAFTVREDKRDTLRAAMHLDASARPQTVTPAANPRYHRMLQHFEGRTGLPAVINTSFNTAGEPIVCTPQDAIRCFYSSGLDGLAIGDFYLAKT